MQTLEERVASCPHLTCACAPSSQHSWAPACSHSPCPPPRSAKTTKTVPAQTAGRRRQRQTRSPTRPSTRAGRHQDRQARRLLRRRAPAAPATRSTLDGPNALGLLSAMPVADHQLEAALGHRLVRLRPRALRHRQGRRSVDGLLVPEAEPRRIPDRWRPDHRQEGRRHPLVPDRGLQRSDARRARPEGTNEGQGRATRSR